jgi:hypothetical protein
MTNDRAYFRLRAEQELAAADKAGDGVAARIHRELAQRFLAMAEVASEPENVARTEQPQ